MIADKEVRAGDTWTVASDRTTAAGPMKLETTYRLENADGLQRRGMAVVGR